MATILRIPKNKPSTAPTNAPSDIPLYLPHDTDIRIEDTRKYSPTTNLPLKSTERKSLNVNTGVISDIVKNAKLAGIDPLTALAVSYQETGFNQEGRGLFNLNPQVYGKPVGNAEEGMKSLQEQFRIGKDLQRRGIIPQTEEHLLQANNGYGIIKRGHADLEGSHKIYGIDIPPEGINFKHQPLYGKTIISLRDILKQHPKIQQIISNTK